MLLWAISVHLLTSRAGDREAEAQALLSDIRADVPTGDYVVIGGDFNTRSRTETAIVGLSGDFVTTGVDGTFPEDQCGNDNTNSTRAHPEDWLLVSHDLDVYASDVSFATMTFPYGLVLDTRVFASPPTGCTTPIDTADIAPALATDSAAPTMQHMGVVRDFVVPE